MHGHNENSSSICATSTATYRHAVACRIESASFPQRFDRSRFSSRVKRVVAESVASSVSPRDSRERRHIFMETRNILKWATDVASRLLKPRGFASSPTRLRPRNGEETREREREREKERRVHGRPRLYRCKSLFAEIYVRATASPDSEAPRYDNAIMSPRSPLPPPLSLFPLAVPPRYALSRRTLAFGLPASRPTPLALSGDSAIVLGADCYSARGR